MDNITLRNTTATTAGQPPDMTQPPPATRYEQMPDELMLLVVECSLRGAVQNPAQSGLPAFDCNQRQHRLLTRPMAAYEVIKALWVAPNLPRFCQAADALAAVPPPYLDLCWQAAWPALAAMTRRLKARQAEAPLTHLLDRLPDAAEMRLLQLRRAATFLLDHGHGAWRSDCADRILRLTAQGPGIPAPLWRQLLQLQHRAPHDASRRALADTPGLSAQQRGQWLVLQDCLDSRHHTPTLQHTQALLARIEAAGSRAIRFDLLCLLRQRLGVFEPAELKQANAALSRALLRLADSPLRPQVLQKVCLRDDPAIGQALPVQLAALAPRVGLQVLIRHIKAFHDSPAHLALLAGCIGSLLARSRQAAQDHAAFLCTLAGLAEGVVDPELWQRLDRLLLDECAALTPAKRLRVLAALQVGIEGEPLLRAEWQTAWDTALQDTVALLSQAGDGTQAGPLIQALLPALRRHESRDTVLGSQLAALRLLDAHAQAPLLRQIVSMLLNGCYVVDDRHKAWLVQACSQLPFYLRATLLERLESLRSWPPHQSLEALAGLQGRTARQRREWAHGQPPG
ncbi:hypothetical protein GT347_15800 [Xylophilus rhododendri]|uniref:Uncharacterized protein n=1 Tax=Xylophilus rhododendri TaxID=2697032 RepID=A0A857J5Q6_9BURK|nr:hypothetical protein [Xylophilus rhododendri]QHI99310.1 hypothetical protein GT347_15800 [Xylophilus rhododendri]